MKNITMKNHIISLMLIVSTMLFLGGCAEEPVEQNVQQENGTEAQVGLEEKRLSMSYQSVFMEEDLLDIACLAAKNATYIAGVRQGTDGFSAQTVVYRWEEGIENPVECAVYEHEKLLCWCSDEIGRIAIISMMVDTNTQEKSFFLHLMEESGEKSGDYALKNVFAEEQGTGSFSVMALEGTKVCVADIASGTVYIFDYEEDCLKQTYEMAIGATHLDYAQGMFYSTDNAGNVYAFAADTGAKQEIGNNAFKDLSYVYSSRTDGETIWSATQDGLYAADLQSGKRKTVVDYLEYDILLQDSTVLYEESESDVWKLVTWGQTGNQVELFALRPAKEGVVQTEKEIITLSVFYVDTSLQEAVVAFNKSNDKYRVEIISGEESMDASEFYDREQLELTTNKGPDIFTKTSDMRFVNYIEKGIVEDLSPYVKRDLKEEDYVESSLYAYSRDGKVYAIESGFMINCLITTKDLVGEKRNWTFLEMAEIMCENQEITSFSEWAEPLEVLRICIGFGGIRPDDYETVKDCILFAKQYGKVLAQGELAVPGKNVLVKEVQINDALDWADIQAKYGEEIVLIGYPRDDLRGIRHSSQGWSINANSDSKEGAWEFLKFLLSENYQRQMEGSFSPRKDIYEEQLKSYLTPLIYDMYLPEAGGVVTIRNSYTLPDSDVEIECMEEQQITVIKELVEESDSAVFSMDYNAWFIIQEEASAYFSDQRALDDVMNNIENRVNLYIQEQK